MWQVYFGSEKKIIHNFIFNFLIRFGSAQIFFWGVPLFFGTGVHGLVRSVTGNRVLIFLGLSDNESCIHFEHDA